MKIIYILFLIQIIFSSYIYSSSINDLTIQINNILTQCQANTSCFGTSWSIAVDQYNSSTGKFDSIYSMNELIALSPASSTKLLTTVVMYLTMGQHYTFQTPFYTDQPYQPGQPINTLCIKGQGDPSITTQQLTQAAQFFAKATSIENLVFDNSYYIGNGVPSSWEWEDLTSNYGALPTTLMVNENTLSFTVTSSGSSSIPTIVLDNPADSAYLSIVNNAVVGSASSTNTLSVDFSLGSIQPILSGSLPAGQSQYFTIPILDPDNYFPKMFAEMIALNSPFNVKPKTVSFGQCNDLMDPVFIIQSDNLDVLLNHTLQTSDNLYAESFLRVMGTFNNNSQSLPSFNDGLFFVQTILSQMGVDPLLYTQTDGCGLSRNNFITSRAFTNVLEAIYENAGDPEHTFFEFLPVAGLSGTLVNRFKGTIAQGIVHAKTGSMTGVASLSGIIAPNGIYKTENPLFMSIIVNNANSKTRLSPLIDSIVLLLTQFSNSSN